MATGITNQQVQALQTGEPTELKLTVAITVPSNLEPALAGVPGNVNNGDHRYKLTFVLDGETTLGAGGDPITVTDKTVDGQVDLTQIPIGPLNTSARKIYRTEANLLVYKLLTTIADNTTTTFTDNIADASLGAEAPTVNTTKQVLITGSGADGLALSAYSTGEISLTVYNNNTPGTVLATLAVLPSGGIRLRAQGDGIFLEGTSLPTVNPNVAGKLWNENGFVRISAG